MDSLDRYHILNINIGIVKRYSDVRYPGAEVIMQMELVAQTAKRLNRMVSNIKTRQNEGLTTVNIMSSARPNKYSNIQAENFKKANTH